MMNRGMPADGFSRAARDLGGPRTIADPLDRRCVNAAGTSPVAAFKSTSARVSAVTSPQRRLAKVASSTRVQETGQASGGLPLQPPSFPLRPFFHRGRPTRGPKHPASELAGAALPVPCRDGRPDQRLAVWGR